MSEFCPRCGEPEDIPGDGYCRNLHPLPRRIDTDHAPAHAPDDPINPPHYTAGAIECIDAIMSAIDGMQAQHAICVGNVIKYLWRLHRKGDAKENARKAAWYLERLVRELG